MAAAMGIQLLFTKMALASIVSSSISGSAASFVANCAPCVFLFVGMIAGVAAPQGSTSAAVRPFCACVFIFYSKCGRKKALRACVCFCALVVCCTRSDLSCIIEEEGSGFLDFYCFRNHHFLWHCCHYCDFGSAWRSCYKSVFMSKREMKKEMKTIGCAESKSHVHFETFFISLHHQQQSLPNPHPFHHRHQNHQNLELCT